MSLIQWEPFREIDDFFRRYSPHLNRVATTGLEKTVGWTPTANISETEKEYLIKAELPEVKKDDVKITLQDGAITISGERKEQKESEQENSLRMESFYGSFSRTFLLPDNVDVEHIQAESKDGMLRIRIPKMQAKQPRRVDIKIQ